MNSREIVLNRYTANVCHDVNMIHFNMHMKLLTAATNCLGCFWVGCHHLML